MKTHIIAFSLDPDSDRLDHIWAEIELCHVSKGARIVCTLSHIEKTIYINHPFIFCHMLHIVPHIVFVLHAVIYD